MAAFAGFRLSRSLLAARTRPPIPPNCRGRARCLGNGASSREQFLITRPGLKAKIIDGKKIAAAVKSEVTDQVLLHLKLFIVCVQYPTTRL